MPGRRVRVGVDIGVALVSFPQLVVEIAALVIDLTALIAGLRFEPLSIGARPLGLRLGFQRRGFPLPQLWLLLGNVAPDALGTGTVPVLLPVRPEGGDDRDDDARKDDSGNDPDPRVHIHVLHDFSFVHREVTARQWAQTRYWHSTDESAKNGSGITTRFVPVQVGGQRCEEVRTVFRFDPFRDIDRLTEQMLGAQAGSARAPRFMPMDLYRSGDHYVLHADLPGIDPGSVDVNVENGTLTVQAERSARTEQDVQWLSSERFTGTFLRQLTLGEGIDEERISATYRNGVLTVTLPVAERAKPRRIDVAAGDDAQTIDSSADQGAIAG